MELVVGSVPALVVESRQNKDLSAAIYERFIDERQDKFKEVVS